MSETLLDIRGLRVDIRTNEGPLHPVRGIDLTVARGETLAIVGESGCGKSLTSLAVMGLLPRNASLTADRIDLLGESLIGLSPKQWQAVRGSRIAMIFQDPMTALDPCYTVGDQMSEVLRQHRRVTRDEARRRSLELLSRVRIPSPEERLGQYPHQLSGGLRQRVMIAMALLCEPELIIADEPTTALDVTIQAQVLKLLADIQRDTGVGMIFITHDIGVVANIADRIAVMYGGQIVEQGVKDALIGSPLHPYTEGLMRAIPVPGRTRRREPLGYIPGIVPRQVGTLSHCGFLDRCPYAMSRCAEAAVPIRNLPGRRSLRCLLPEDGRNRHPDAWLRPDAVAASNEA